MRARPAKEAGKVVLEINPLTEPRITEAFFGSLQRLASMRIKRILATTDFSELSLDGVEYAIAIAKQMGGAVTLVKVVQPSVYLGGMEAVVIARNDETIVKLEKRDLAALAKKLSKNGKPIRSVTRYGKAYREITALAAELDSDLIVTTTHGYSGLKRALIGSTAEWVVRYAPCPVLTVPARSTGRKTVASWASNIERIVVPIDFSETSAKALPYAAALAEYFNAKITLVHVTEMIATAGPRYIPSVSLQEEMVKSAEELLLRTQREGLPESIDTKALVLTGTPYYEITRTAARSGADLIVLTTHGRTGLKHMLLGSTAERVVRHASCPVLVVRGKIPS